MFIIPNQLCGMQTKLERGQIVNFDGEEGLALVDYFVEMEWSTEVFVRNSRIELDFPVVHKAKVIMGLVDKFGVVSVKKFEFERADIEVNLQSENSFSNQSRQGEVFSTADREMNAILFEPRLFIFDYTALKLRIDFGFYGPR